jgi:RNase P/RNase MRP subunit p30
MGNFLIGSLSLGSKLNVLKFEVRVWEFGTSFCKLFKSPWISGKNMEIIRNLKDLKGKKRPVLLDSTNYKELRSAAERGAVDGFVRTEFYPKKDSMHYRKSVIDDILAKFMAEKKVRYVIDIDAVLGGENSDVSLGRVIQNLMLCRKYGVTVGIINSSQGRDLVISRPDVIISFLETLGMEKKDAKKILKGDTN